MVDTASAVAPAVTPEPSPAGAAPATDSRAALLAGIAKMRAGTAQVAAPPTDDQKPAVIDPAAAEPAGDKPEPAKPADKVEPDKTEGDPAGMAAVRKAEQHMRRQLAQERAEMRAEFERERAAMQRQIEELTGVKATLANGRRDPLAAAKAMGYSETELETLARQLYAASPEGQKDPRHRAAAEQLRERGDTVSKVEQLQAKIDQLEQGLNARDQAVQQQARAERYMASVTGAVTDETPLAKAALGKNPDKTTAKLFEIAVQLYTASGPSDDLREDPTPAEVLRAYDKLRAAELEELGIDPKIIARPAPAPTTRPAVTLEPGGASPIAPRPPTKTVTREELLAGIQKMKQAAAR